MNPPLKKSTVAAHFAFVRHFCSSVKEELHTKKNVRGVIKQQSKELCSILFGAGGALRSPITTVMMS